MLHLLCSTLRDQRSGTKPRQDQVFDRVAANRPAVESLADGAMDMIHLEALEAPQDLNGPAFAGLRHPGLEQPAQRGELSVANSWGSSQPGSGAA
jgi:hypothetical protein